MFKINSQKRGWGLKRPKGERGGIRISQKKSPPNKMGNKLVKNTGNYNFLSFCRKGFNYEFIDSVISQSRWKYRTVLENENWVYKKEERN
jgi:hypothetical protein